MKKLTPKRLPRKLVLRSEAVAQLTPTQLGQVVAGVSFLGDCSRQSNNQITCLGNVG